MGRVRAAGAGWNGSLKMMETPPGISRGEFEDRRRRAAQSAREEGLRGLLVCSRGGGTVDRYGDVKYLSDFYTPFPYIPDLAGHWSGRAHTFLVLPVDDDPILIVDVPPDETIALAPERIVYGDLVIENAVDALRRTGLDRGAVGIVGRDVLSISAFQKIENAVPSVEWRDAQHILARLRAIKSPAEIGLIRHSARIGSRMIEAMMEAAVPGATHGDIVAAGQQVLVPAGGILYNSFMASGRGGAEPLFVKSNFPTWASPAPLGEGQWLRLGISGVVQGYYFDVSRSKAIGPPTNQQIDLFEAAIECVHAGIAACHVGSTAEQVAKAGLDKQKSLGYEIKGVFSGLGHGIGLGWDIPWLAPGDDLEIQANMALNFERTIRHDGFVGDFEETVVVTPEGPETLTDAKIRYW
jgi:Xaa-Pro aminopeptidase